MFLIKYNENGSVLYIYIYRYLNFLNCVKTRDLILSLKNNY